VREGEERNASFHYTAASLHSDRAGSTVARALLTESYSTRRAEASEVV
jgi:hypothetical protein